MKICSKCGLSKKVISFPNKKSNICWKCKADSALAKSIRHMEKEDLPLETLDGSETINILGMYFKNNYAVSREAAFELMSKVDYKILDGNTIYLKEAFGQKKEDIVVRVNVLERDDYTCQYCGAEGDTMDHIYPESKGGEYTEENLVVACKKCNALKGNLVISREDMVKLIKKNDKAKLNQQRNLIQNKKKKEMEALRVMNWIDELDTKNKKSKNKKKKSIGLMMNNAFNKNK